MTVPLAGKRISPRATKVARTKRVISPTCLCYKFQDFFPLHENIICYQGKRKFDYDKNEL